MHRGGAGWINYNAGQPQVRDGSYLTAITGGFQVQYADGKLDTFTNVFVEGIASSIYFLSSSTDPPGNQNTFSYTTVGGVIQLSTITDAIGQTTHLYYANSSFPNLITSVTDPFSRTCYLTYDTNGFLTNITDVVGMNSSFAYDSVHYTPILVTNLTTPYGQTSFHFAGSDYSHADTIVKDSVEVTLPTGGKELYVYVPYDENLEDWNPAVPDTSPFDNTFEDSSSGTYQLRESYHWSPLQYGELSSAYLDSDDPDQLTSADYLNGRLRHWLDSANGGAALSIEQAPSTDGVTPGQATWYDYENKYDGQAGNEGTSDFPSFIAQVLPDGTPHFSYSLRGPDLNVTNEVSTYTTPAGSIGLRTNEYIYAANNIDLLQWVGPNGEQVVSNYFAGGNTIHRPNATYDALNQQTAYTYNSLGQLTSVQTPAGLVTTNIYYASGTSINRLETTIDLQILRTNSYTYYANGLPDTHTDERGLTTTMYWDNLQRLTGISYPDGTTTSNLYTYLDVTGTKDRLGNWTLYQYNGIRQRIAETNANGVVTAYSYCQCGLLYSVTNAWNTPVQMVTSYGYDNQGNRLYIILPDETITNTYDALARLTWTCDAWGCRKFMYNNQSLLTTISNNAGLERSILYDNEDRPVFVTDANQVLVTNTYDLLGRLTTRTYPDGGVEAFGYSAFGLVAYTNQIGDTNFYGYDAALRKTFETNANGEVIRYTNSPAGDLLTLTDGKGQTTTWNYDSFGRVTKKLDQSNTVVFTYQYDADNRLTVRSNIVAGGTFYSYDNVGNLTNIAYGNFSYMDAEYQYDALNRLTNMVDDVGVTVYTYSSGGFLASEGGLFVNDTVTNFYANRMRIGFSLQQPEGAWTNGFGYDALKRLTSVTSSAGTFAYNYDALRQREVTNLTLPNTSYVSNYFDPVARLLGTVLNTSGASVLDSAAYGYNLAGQRVNFTNTAGTVASYAYDPAGQLKVAASTTSSESRGYAYDAAWNLISRTNNTTPTTYTNNGLNELTKEGSVNCTYDATGNLIEKATTMLATNFLYDGENRLAAVTYPLSLELRGETSFVYDGLGRLRSQMFWQSNAVYRGNAIGTGGGGGSGWDFLGGIYYIYDGKRVIQERDVNSNNPKVSYTRGNDLSGSLEGAGGIGGLLERADGYNPSNGTWTNHNYYHADGNGNITYMESNSQTLAASYRYDAFGNTLASSGALASSNTYRFSSKEFIPTAGLYYYLYRFYDPILQRWANRDPIADNGAILIRDLSDEMEVRNDTYGAGGSGGLSLPSWISINQAGDPMGGGGGLNLYASCFNDPINMFDIFGLCPPDCAEERKAAQNALNNRRKDKKMFDKSARAVERDAVGIGIGLVVATSGLSAAKTPGVTGVVGAAVGGLAAAGVMYGGTVMLDDYDSVGEAVNQYHKDDDEYKKALKALRACQKAANNSKNSINPK